MDDDVVVAIAVAVVVVVVVVVDVAADIVVADMLAGDDIVNFRFLSTAAVHKPVGNNSHFTIVIFN